MSGEPTVEQLVAAARARAGSDEELALLDAVIALAEDLGARADHAVDQVVGRTRAAGHSWTVIGERLGVSRQAARQRYADRVDQPPRSLGVIRGRDLETALTAALDAAEAQGLTEAGTEHLLLGLMSDGIAAAALEKLGVTREKIQDAARSLFGPSPAARRPAKSVFTAEAEGALAVTDRLATEHTPDCAPVVATTPQLLFVIATNPGSHAHRVLQYLGVDVADIKRQLHCYVTVPRTALGRRSRRRRRDEGQAHCSFCAKPRTDNRPLATGPHVAICADCLALYGEALAAQTGESPT